MNDKFFSTLGKDAAVLTANRRLANQLHYEYTKYQKTKGNIVWETPNILPLNTWLELLWKAQNGNPILSDFQERCLWKKISGQPWSSISLIQQAWKNLALWNISLSSLNNQYNDTADAFLCWANEFKKQCEQLGYLTAAEIPSQLKIEKPSSKKALLIGFDDLPPAVEAFLKKISLHSNDFSWMLLNTTENREIQNEVSINRTTLKNTETEIQAMAQWAKEKYQTNHSIKIGCIIPNLTQLRIQTVRIFNETFSKEDFNISAAQSLTEFVIIQHAINVLQLCQQERKEIDWEALLQSPYLSSSDDDIDLGALVDEKRRETLEIDFSLSALLPILSGLHTRFPKSTWLKRWHQFLNKIKTLPRKQAPSDWSQTFILLLKTLAWPGHRSLNSVEHQVVERFKKSLNEFSQCDDIFHNIDYDTALNIFTYQLSTIQFQPEGSDAAIQILGLLESSGIHFDALWVMGLQDGAWPPAPSPNPFIPHELQVQHKMPHSCAARELDFTIHTMKRLVTSAKEIMLSSPSQEEDQMLQPSQLIQSYPKLEFNLSKKKFSLAINLETIEDRYGPAVSNTEAIQGGSWILKQQAICPFRAFASIRLNASSPKNTYIGISPQEKGKLLHRSLESIWIALKDQTTLLNLSEQQLIDLIEKTVSKEIFEASKPSQSKSYQHFLILEQKRLSQVLKEWLNIEKKRPSFTVLEHETKRHITIGPLTLNLQIDRIDELNNGKHLIIDYKTGLTNIAHWFSDRPSEPQLPLYCAYDQTGSKAYVGATYAQIQTGKMTFKGICKENLSETPAKGITSIDHYKNVDDITDWKNMLTHWKTTLTALSESFCAGHAEVEPLETACQLCDLQPLCRVRENG